MTDCWDNIGHFCAKKSLTLSCRRAGKQRRWSACCLASLPSYLLVLNDIWREFLSAHISDYWEKCFHELASSHWHHCLSTSSYLDHGRVAMSLPWASASLCWSHFQPYHILCALRVMRERGKVFFVTSLCSVPLQGFPFAPLPGSTSQAYVMQRLVLFLFILFQVLGQK